MDKRNDLRNIAIIAHVDHGKTTLVDQLLRQSGVFSKHENVVDRVMDSDDLEKERGITIFSKNASVDYEGVRVNIVDTPGHADFGGEVERILTMVDGVLLLIDAFEGCMPQTRFVLRKALELKKYPIVVVNKIDRPGARPNEVIDQVLELFIELGADEEQIDFPIVYASARDGYAMLDYNEKGQDMKPLFETIISKVPAPCGEADEPLQLLFTNIDYDEYIGRIGIGRIVRGKLQTGHNVTVCKSDGSFKNERITKVFQYRGLKRTEVSEASFGDIVCVAGIADLNIGETACSPDKPEPLPFVAIDEPTITMNFMVNNSPFAGREGKFVTSRHLRERLMKEVQTNVSLRVAETDSPDCFKVSGRGELHLSILIENMRRQDYEFQVSRPKVIFKTIDGEKYEPIELLHIDVKEEYVGTVIEKLGNRKSELVNMCPDDNGNVKLEFKIPARGLIGYHSEFLTDTKGSGVMNHVFFDYEPYKGDMSERERGSIVAWETGETTSYGLFNAQSRGRLFLGPGVHVYNGMVVGEHAKAGDLRVNVCKKKQMTNIRAAGSDDALKLVSPSVLSLEQALEFIADNELLEVTPKNIRIRKFDLNAR